LNLQHCPDCHHELVEVTFKSQKGGNIHCYYCSHCGGSFFEHWDSNLLSLSEIKNDLEKVFFQEEEVDRINLEPECPFDQSIMRAISSEAIPLGVHIFACPSCHGNWFPKAELVRFKQGQEKKIFGLKMSNIPLTSISAVFLPVLFVAFMFGSVFLARQTFLSPKPSTVTVGAAGYFKLLQIKAVKPSSVEISFFTDDPVKTTVLYKENGMDAISSFYEADYSRYHYIVIKDLVDPGMYMFQMKSVALENKLYESEWMSAK
jgi:Zn-finger nucleic acid-binding protein